jgi:hypothetical protein
VSNQPSPKGGSGSCTPRQRAEQLSNLKLTRLAPFARLALSASSSQSEPTRRKPPSKSTSCSRRVFESEMSWKIPVHGSPSRPFSLRKSTSFSVVHSRLHRPAMEAPAGEGGSESIARSI